MTAAADTQLKFSAPHLRVPLCKIYSAKYGSDLIAAKHCGFRKPPLPPRGLWQHGVIPGKFELVQADQVFGATIANLPSFWYWVATKPLEAFVRKCGFANVRAIGLPIVYLPERTVGRRKESLLVMPPHSTGTVCPDWDTRSYVDAVSSLRKEFREIVICVSAQCWANGLWVSEFKAAGFKVVRGADPKADNALECMADLFSEYEFVTTNAYGSHLAYASAFGAKVSIFGPYAEPAAESLANSPFYIDNPHLAEAAEKSYCEARMRHYFPEFFCHPREALQRTAWGRSEVGFDNKVSPEEMRELFGWTLAGRVRARGLPLKQKFEKLLKRNTGEKRELKRLKGMPRCIPGKAKLFGREFGFVDAANYLQKLDQLFNRQWYRFSAKTDRPLVVDVGAEIGMSVLYFKCLYPQSRVIAFEADPAVAEVLEGNCRVYELEDVQIIRQSLGGCERLTDFQQETPPKDEILAGPRGGEFGSMPTHRLRNYLNQPIDLLKLSIEGAVTEVLFDCADCLKNVRNIVVEHQSVINQPQDLHIVIDLLQKIGFRLYVEPGAQSRQPLFQRRIVQGADVHLTIFGFRI